MYIIIMYRCVRTKLHCVCVMINNELVVIVVIDVVISNTKLQTLLYTNEGRGGGGWCSPLHISIRIISSVCFDVQFNTPIVRPHIPRRSIRRHGIILLKRYTFPIKWIFAINTIIATYTADIYEISHIFMICTKEFLWRPRDVLHSTNRLLQNVRGMQFIAVFFGEFFFFFYIVFNTQNITAFDQ